MLAGLFWRSLSRHAVGRFRSVILVANSAKTAVLPTVKPGGVIVSLASKTPNAGLTPTLPKYAPKKIDAFVAAPKIAQTDRSALERKAAWTV